MNDDNEWHVCEYIASHIHKKPLGLIQLHNKNTANQIQKHSNVAIQYENFIAISFVTFNYDNKKTMHLYVTVFCFNIFK